MSSDPEQGEGPRLGDRLQQAREAMGRSLDDMAEELRLTADQVQALEAEDYRKLPAEAYVRGYLRNYAAALGLPPEDLIAAYEQRPVGSQKGDEDEAPLIPEPEKPLIEHPWRVVWISLALLVAVSVFTIWLVGESQEPRLADQGDGPGKPSATQQDQAASGEGRAETGGAEPEDRQVNGQAAPEEAAAEPETSDSPATDKGQGAGESASLPAKPPEADMPATAPNASLPGPALETPRLDGPTLSGPELEEPSQPEVAVRGDQGSEMNPEDLQGLRVHTWAKSWLEVADDRGRVLLRRLVPEGRDLRLYGQAPFQVKIGNAAGVQLYFEGKPLAPVGGAGEVVRLNVDADSPTIPESEVAPPASFRQTGEAAGDDGSGAGGAADGDRTSSPSSSAGEPPAESDTGEGGNQVP
jgi:cytoskeleton protein RodZ